MYKSRFKMAYSIFGNRVFRVADYTKQTHYGAFDIRAQRNAPMKMEGEEEGKKNAVSASTRPFNAFNEQH